MRGRPKDTRDYILYKGDDVLAVGTLEEIEKITGHKRRTLQFLKSPAYLSRPPTQYKRLHIQEIESEADDE